MSQRLSGSRFSHLHIGVGFIHDSIQYFSEQLHWVPLDKTREHFIGLLNIEFLFFDV